MRKLIVLAALAALAVPVALAQPPFPEKIALPDGFGPEGIEVGRGQTVYVGSVQSGSIWMGDLRTGAGDVVVAGARGTRGAAGIEYDRGLLWVAGAGFGTARVYDARTFEVVREYQLATTPPGTFINDVVVTKGAAYFTDSQRPVLYKVAISANGEPGELTTLGLGGEYAHVPGQFNLNGIVATPNGKALIAVQTFARKLLLIDPSTGEATEIDLGGYDLVNGDGLLLHGKTLYVVQNRSNKIAIFRLSDDLTTATFQGEITDPDFDIPTTIDRAGSRLYVVNARFGRTTPTDQSYHVVKAG